MLIFIRFIIKIIRGNIIILVVLYNCFIPTVWKKIQRWNYNVQYIYFLKLILGIESFKMSLSDLILICSNRNFKTRVLKCFVNLYLSLDYVYLKYLIIVANVYLFLCTNTLWDNFCFGFINVTNFKLFFWILYMIIVAGNK